MSKSSNTNNELREIVFQIVEGDTGEYIDYTDGGIWVRDEAIEAIQQYFLELIGENEQEFHTPKPELATMVRNRFRESLRKKVLGE